MNKRVLAGVLLTAGTACHAPESPSPAPFPAPGVSRELATRRARTLSDIRYEVTFSVPASLGEEVRGHETIRFVRAKGAGPLILDFDGEAVLSVHAGSPGKPAGEVPFRFEDGGHVILLRNELAAGENVVKIDFEAGDSSLNRRESFLYTLFVPDRAHRAFPCFDQPDLKARFRLNLEIPARWQAVSNAPGEVQRSKDGRATWTFEETAPISTYLFAFAAGELQVETAERNGRTMRFFHRETDADKVARNAAALFDLHAVALSWLEDYTAIPYPFPKLDFVLVPDFQYGGMEHPGAIFYRDRSLLLDESATQDDDLGRASLIAHETSHMWFGDLVTMRWFDDVWMKEVFANFMAARIVHPSFPEIDHELRFVLEHFPAAYDVDRSRGANPIRQELDNLDEAGSLYGAIIYQKAPIVMRHLELLMGDEEMRDGLREYLGAHRFANASWPDLIATLDPRTEVDLASWSRGWVEEPGRPVIAAELETRDGRIRSLDLSQSDPWKRGRLWNQRLELVLGGADGVRRIETRLDEAIEDVAEARGLPAPAWVLHGGLAYGRFSLDPATREYLLAHAPEIGEPMLRAVAWLSLWDELLEGHVRAEALFDTALAWLATEPETLLVEQLLSDLNQLFWRYLPETVREARAAELEALLWRRLEAAPEASLKSTFFRAYVATARTAPAVDRLARIWRGELEIPGLPLAEEDFISLALELAVREAPGSAEILEGQLARIENPDRKERFAFVKPALSADPAVREAFFESLKEAVNREQERWVLEALHYLHHPLRAKASLPFVLPSLELLEEIQRTGDIFFPKRWLDATLWGHSSAEAAAIVRDFLDARSEYPPRLRAKILQSADGLFRASAAKAAH